MMRAARAASAATQIIPTGRKITIIVSKKRSPSAPSLPENRKNAAEITSHNRLSAAAVSSIPLNPLAVSPGRDRTGAAPACASSFLVIAGSARSDIVYFQNFVGFVAAGGAHFDTVAFFLADQGAGDRGFDVQKPFLDIRFVLTDDLPGLFLIRVLVHQGDRGAELDRTGKLGGVDHFNKAQHAFQFLDAPLDEALLFARRMVLGVFLEVPQLPRLGYRLDDSGAFFGLERFQFRFQRGVARAGHW